MFLVINNRSRISKPCCRCSTGQGRTESPDLRTATPGQAGENRLSRESLVKNLDFASAWTEPGGGVGAVLGSGFMIANNI